LFHPVKVRLKSEYWWRREVHGGDIRDDDGRTIIDWMNDYASDRKNLDDIVWKGDVERLIEIGQVYAAKGCREFSSVCG
jgi:hypothetical protein